MDSKKILIIEDEPEAAKVVQTRLMSNGYIVSIAYDAVIGIKLTREFKPDLIVLDLMLPAGGGKSVLESIACCPDTEAIPVLVLTGIKDETYKKLILDYPAVKGYMEKPYNAKEFVEAIKKILLD